MTDESNSHRGATNQQQVPWYAEGLSFTCTGCGNCCTGAPGFVWVREEEIDQLADWLTMDRAQFVRQYVRKVGRRKSLVEYASGDCVFFDPETRRCRVYPVRPGQCRTWPFWDSNLRSLQPGNRPVRSVPGQAGVRWSRSRRLNGSGGSSPFDPHRYGRTIGERRRTVSM